MTRDKILVQFPQLDHDNHVANISIEKTVVDTEKGITLEDAFENKKDSLFLVVTKLGELAELTIKSGDTYPNFMLGDIKLQIPIGTSAINLKDVERYAKEDKSLDLDFSKEFVGTVFAIAKWGGV